jgi:hypothetical protein
MMKRRVAGLGVSLAALGALLIPAAASAGTLDQEQALSSGASHSIYDDDGMGSSGQSVAQTFTAGLTGDLDQVDMNISKFGTPTADLTVQIWDTVGGTPVNVLATESVPAASLTTTPAFTPVTFDPRVPVTAGTQYAIVAWAATPFASPYSWTEAGANPYAAGELRVQLAPNASPPTPGFWGPSGATFDMTFRTYVVTPPTTTPPPPTTTGPTGQRAAALAKCKKKRKKLDWSKRRYKKCKKQANLLPV